MLSDILSDMLSGISACSKCPDADIILCIARALPAFLLTLVDTGIFYTVRAGPYSLTLYPDIMYRPSTF